MNEYSLKSLRILQDKIENNKNNENINNDLYALGMTLALIFPYGKKPYNCPYYTLPLDQLTTRETCIDKQVPSELQNLDSAMQRLICELLECNFNKITDVLNYWTNLKKRHQKIFVKEWINTLLKLLNTLI
jgi:hypothetical protein